MLESALLEISEIFSTNSLLNISISEIFQIRKTVSVQIKINIVLVIFLIRTEIISIVAIVIFLSLF